MQNCSYTSQNHGTNALSWDTNNAQKVLKLEEKYTDKNVEGEEEGDVGQIDLFLMRSVLL